MVTSSVAYVVSTSVLPLGFIWMFNSRLEAELIQQNLLDPLTQVLNRRGFRHALDLEMAQHVRSQAPFGFVIMDLDHFKQLNDTHGHACGDAVLLGLAMLLKKQIRESDTVARMGGEEFVLLLPDTGKEEAATLLEGLRREVERYSEFGEGVRVTASFGVTMLEAKATRDVSELLREADTAMYRAKEMGRNRVCFFEGGVDGREMREKLE
jgi:diguanylate cyclase (GGDEF)-like protein